MVKTKFNMRGALGDINSFSLFLSEIVQSINKEDFNIKNANFNQLVIDTFITLLIYLEKFFDDAQKEGLILEIEPICKRILFLVKEFRTTILAKINTIQEDPKLLEYLTYLTQQSSYSTVMEYLYRSKIAKKITNLMISKKVDIKKIIKETGLPPELVNNLISGSCPIPTQSDICLIDKAFSNDPKSVDSLTTIVFEYQSEMQKNPSVNLKGKMKVIGILT